MFVFDFGRVFLVFMESFECFLVVVLGFEVYALCDAEMRKMVEKNRATVIRVHHFESTFRILDFQTPLPQFFQSIFEFLKIDSLVLRGV